ncbi:MAG: right-handed parallel beta-helix repeat-containing protein [Verrucomicrobia bacterium]|nr:right-handed parallel beta-helix repeat-containing protein [Verrucomicrobiota bacterium]
MKLTNSLLILFGLMLSRPAHSQVLTAQVGAPPPAPTILVNTNDTWSYRKGLSEPQVDWHTVADGDLDTTWLTGPGGFGFGDGDDATVLDDMLNGYTTVYVRKSFEIPAGTDPSRRVILTMDWDDGFVAYLDGVEVRRSSNVSEANPLFDAVTVANQNHEAHGGGGAIPTFYDLGTVGALLPEGSHVLSIIGLNGGAASSDFSLTASLRLEGGASAAGGGALFAIVDSAVVPVSGTNTIPGATRVTVNGEEASYNPVTGEWSWTATLASGLNSLFVAALAEDGALLASTNRDVFFRQTTVDVGGDVVGSGPFNTVTWAFGPSTVLVTNTVTVKSGTYLLISNTVAVLFSPGTSLRVEPGASLIIKDDGFSLHPGKPILFAPADGSTLWGVSANGGLLWMNDCEVIAGQIVGVSNAVVRVEDCILRDFRSASRLLLAATNAASFTLRDSHLARYDQARFSGTPVLIEGCLIEQVFSDATDFADSTNIVVKSTTYRHGIGSNTDAIDLGGNPGAVINGVIIHGFPDKGVSIAGQSHGTVVSNSLIFGNGIGISAYAASNCVFNQNTVADNSTGILMWERNAGDGAGYGAGTNLIVFGNVTNIHLAGGGVLNLSYSDVEGGLVSGVGNISADPLFEDADAAGYRLLAGSPALGSGWLGSTMGAMVPFHPGGMLPAPYHLQAVVSGTNHIQLSWREDALGEIGFSLERSFDGQGWNTIAFWDPVNGGLTENVTSFTDTNTSLNQRYFYRVRAGNSKFSSIAGAIRQEPNLVVGGLLPADTTWSPMSGSVTVVSNLFVPSGVTLTILPGTVVKLTNLVSIIAAGGTINVAGTVENKVRFQPLVGTNIWGQLSGQFGSSFTVRHAEIISGQLTVYSNAVGLIEDVYIHDYRRAGGSLFTAPIILTHFAAPTTVRRTIVREYHETLWRNGVLLIEECLFENIYGDAVDFDAAQTGTVIRNCTFRHGNRGNVDAVDVGPGDLPGAFDVRIENCLMFDFPFDKGVSVGDNNASRGTIVSNCFMYACLSGVMAKDRCDVSVRNCTIVDNAWGLTNYNKVSPSSSTGGGITTNTYNNIVVGNTITISMANGGQLFADHNIFSNTNWPGEGNIDVNPLFVNPAGRDYRLAENSPARTAGRDGAEMGARFPGGSGHGVESPAR